MRLLPTIILLFSLPSSTFPIHLVDNGYTDVVIAINREIEEDESLIDSIRNLISDASPHLYRATRKRAYFKDVTIVVPEEWQDKPEYLPATARETFSSARIRINPPLMVHGNKIISAFVEAGTSICGQERPFMHITPERITDSFLQTYSPPHKMLVHEWGHLRWGLYDEYYQSAFGPDFDGKPSRCVQKIDAIITPDGKREYNTQGISASIMWNQRYEEVVDFCDDSDNATVKHYRESNTAQNRYCGMKSAWEVMRKTEDFRDGMNPPREITSVTPHIRVVRKKSSAVAVVLVLDISESMCRKQRLTLLNQATRTYINQIEEGSLVGIVSFSDVAMVTQNLTKITDQASRDTFSSVLPTKVDLREGTSIGAAVLKALGVLTNAPDEQKQLLVITDGSENEGPCIMDEEVQRQVHRSGVKIDTVGIGKAAEEKLNSLAEETGGMAFFHDEKSDEPSALHEAIGSLLEKQSSEEHKMFQVERQMMTIDGRKAQTVEIDFDDGIGQDTVFNFFWTSAKFKLKHLKVTVKSADGKFYKYKRQNGDISCSRRFKMCFLKVKGKIEPSTWTLTIQNRGSKSVTICWEVFSHKPPTISDSVTLDTRISQFEVTPRQPVVITASVTKGTHPVVGAVVSAVVTRPSSRAVTVVLHDDGAEPDMMADDGVYACTFTQFSGRGRYNVKVIASQTDVDISEPISSNDVKNILQTRKNRRAGVGFRRIFDDSPDDFIFPRKNEPVFDAVVALDKFTRIQSTGMFSVTNYSLSREDAFPPSRIIDLRRELTVDNNVVLLWTAPGDDMDHNQASRYSIRVSSSFNDLADNFNNQRELTHNDLVSPDASTMKPKMAGHPETITFSPPIDAKMIFTAIKTQDKSGQWSDLSNVVYVNMKPLTPKQCNCPVKSTLQNAICNDDFVVVGTVKNTNRRDVIQLQHSEFLHSNVAAQLRRVSRVRVDIDENRSDGCVCTVAPQEGRTYVMSGSSVHGHLELTDESYLQPAPISIRLLKDTIAKLVDNCSNNVVVGNAV